MKQTKMIIVLMVMAVLMACQTTREVPFAPAHNYYVRNDAPRPVPMKITTQDAFERFFGMAAFMGKNGQPTPIDFEHQFVIAIVLPETNHSTTIDVERLTNKAEGLAVSAKIEVSEKENSWTQVPMQLLIVDRSHERDSVFLK